MGLPGARAAARRMPGSNLRKACSDSEFGVRRAFQDLFVSVQTSQQLSVPLMSLRRSRSLEN
eukprot:2755216-Pyramimonas_sp.AAC.1